MQGITNPAGVTEVTILLLNQHLPNKYIYENIDSKTAIRFIAN